MVGGWKGCLFPSFTSAKQHRRRRRKKIKCANRNNFPFPFSVFWWLAQNALFFFPSSTVSSSFSISFISCSVSLSAMLDWLSFLPLSFPVLSCRVDRWKGKGKGVWLAQREGRQRRRSDGVRWRKGGKKEKKGQNESEGRGGRGRRQMAKKGWKKKLRKRRRKKGLSFLAPSLLLTKRYWSLPWKTGDRFSFTPFLAPSLPSSPWLAGWLHRCLPPSLPFSSSSQKPQS